MKKETTFIEPIVGMRVWAPINAYSDLLYYDIVRVAGEEVHARLNTGKRTMANFYVDLASGCRVEVPKQATLAWIKERLRPQGDSSTEGKEMASTGY
jgi:hypothetical protein